MFKWLSKKLGVSKQNCIVYVIGLMVSVALILPYCFCSSTINTILSSVGASGIGAVLLGIFIERANNIQEEKRKQENRQKLIFALTDDMTTILCHEILILEKEDADFATDNIGKSLADILEKIPRIYIQQATLTPPTSDEYDTFNAKHKSRFQIRHNIINKLSGRINYAADDIYYNRSYNIDNGLFTDEEIQVIKLIQFSFNDLKTAEDYTTYLYCFNQLLDRLSYLSNSIFAFLKSSKRTDEGFSTEKNSNIFINYESWIKEYEIQI